MGGGHALNLALKQQVQASALKAGASSGAVAVSTVSSNPVPLTGGAAPSQASVLSEASSRVVHRVKPAELDAFELEWTQQGARIIDNVERTLNVTAREPNMVHDAHRIIRIHVVWRSCTAFSLQERIGPIYHCCR